MKKYRHQINGLTYSKSFFYLLETFTTILTFFPYEPETSQYSKSPSKSTIAKLTPGCVQTPHWPSLTPSTSAEGLPVHIRNSPRRLQIEFGGNDPAVRHGCDDGGGDVGSWRTNTIAATYIIIKRICLIR